MRTQGSTYPPKDYCRNCQEVVLWIPQYQIFADDRKAIIAVCSVCDKKINLLGTTPFLSRARIAGRPKKLATWVEPKAAKNQLGLEL